MHCFDPLALLSFYLKNTNFIKLFAFELVKARLLESPSPPHWTTKSYLGVVGRQVPSSGLFSIVYRGWESKCSEILVQSQGK